MEEELRSETVSMQRLFLVAYFLMGHLIDVRWKSRANARLEGP